MEYKFRGKRKDNGEWVVGCLVSTTPDEAFILIGVTGHIKRDDYECYMIEVIPETVGMWTGLKDKNGKDIYEGDILKSFSSYVPSYEIFYCKSSYRLRYKLKSGDFYDWGPLYRMDEILTEGHLEMYPEVIGNIHDNPELLNPPQGYAAQHTMNNFDPAAKAPDEPKATGETNEQATEQIAAQESEAQDQAMDAEEGSTEG